MKREVTVELSSENFLCTGIKSDLCQVGQGTHVRRLVGQGTQVSDHVGQGTHVRCQVGQRTHVSDQVREANNVGQAPDRCACMHQTTVAGVS